MMIERVFRRGLAILLLAVSPVAVAQTPAATADAPDEPVIAARGASSDDADAAETRGKLGELLRRYPPDVARVLKLDPTLLGNDAYMASYPALSAFVAEHPSIARDPEYFLEGIWIPRERGPETEMVELWMNTMGGLAALTVFGVVTAVLTWLVRTIIEQKRWSRLSRVQQDVHTKLLDRLTSNEDLLAYIQSSPGKRFLEAAPIPVEVSARGVSAPINRILWSVQAGLVMAALGIGVQFVSGHVPNELDPPLFVMGIVALSIGIGFILSAIVSFALSRRLGLWPPPPVGGDDERPDTA